MKNGTCPKCGLVEIYVSNSPYPDSIVIKSLTRSISARSHWEKV
jgi:hypothetical protein